MRYSLPNQLYSKPQARCIHNHAYSSILNSTHAHAAAKTTAGTASTSRAAEAKNKTAASNTTSIIVGSGCVSSCLSYALA